jgi:hypothetical protein
MNKLSIAASSVLIIVPSPLEGEGCSAVSARSDLVRGSLRKKAYYEGDPSPNRALWNDRLALSLKGRGRSNAHPIANS